MKGMRKMLGATTVAGVVAVGALLVSGAGASGSPSSQGGADARDGYAFERISPGEEKRSLATLAMLGDAQSAGLVDSYRFAGTQENDNILVTKSDGGRFVLRSRARSLTPISPPLGCRVDSSHQVSCNPGLIKSFVARMKRGRDRVAVKNLRIPVFMVGGPGGDRLIAGNGNSTLKGKRGPDRLVGNGGVNLLSGGKGRDVITAGPRRNRVRGGPGFDVCINNRKGNNTFRGCGVIRRR